MFYLPLICFGDTLTSNVSNFNHRALYGYRSNSDRSFLSEIKSEDLSDLVYCLTHEKNGGTRLTEELTMSSDYKSYQPDHHQYWRLIAAQIQCFGANSITTMFRGGEGVLYKEVLKEFIWR